MNTVIDILITLTYLYLFKFLYVKIEILQDNCQEFTMESYY